MREMVIIFPVLLSPEPTAAAPPPRNSINTQLGGLMGLSLEDLSYHIHSQTPNSEVGLMSPQGEGFTQIYN